MKRIVAIFLVVVICLSLSACDFNILSVEKLMRPPKLSGESSLLQTAFEESVADAKGIIMKTPISGENRSSYLFFDMENDGIKEAIVFFSEPLNDTLASASIFKFNDNEWKLISKIKGKGEEIYEVNFADLNRDGTYEILLSWTGIVISEKANVLDFGSGNSRVLTVYSCDGVTTTLLKTESYTNMVFEDLNNDNGDEIVLFRINLSDNEKRTTARILSFNDDYSINYDKLLTLTGLLEINNIVIDTTDIKDNQHTRIFIDGAVSEIGIITEVIDISHKAFEITLPLYEQNQSHKPLTLRDSRIYSTDIDNDGIIEIPTSEIMPFGARILENSSERKELNLTVWSELVQESIKVDFKCLLNSSYGYMFLFPVEAINKITAIYDDNNMTLTFYQLNESGTYKKEMFSVRAFLEHDWEENHYKYTELIDNDMFVYGYMMLDDENNEEYKEFISNNFYILK